MKGVRGFPYFNDKRRLKDKHNPKILSLLRQLSPDIFSHHDLFVEPIDANSCEVLKNLTFFCYSTDSQLSEAVDYHEIQKF